MRILRNLWSGCDTSANRPHRLIRNDDFLPLVCGDLVGHGLQLSKYYIICIARLPIAELFADAHNDAEASLDPDFCFGSNVLAGLTLERAAFRMARNDPFKAEVSAHVRRDI